MEDKRLTTTFHLYEYDTEKPDERAAWEELKARLEAEGRDCFESLSPKPGGGHHSPFVGHDGEVIELETKDLFNNQWNTAPNMLGSADGWRVFDWALDARFSYQGQPLLRFKTGHWLAWTDAMRAIRRDTLKCGYCGKQEPASAGLVFCPHCLDSEYLKAADLPLTRLVPVADSRIGWELAPLTDAEKAERLPLFREAQLHGTTERGKARRKREREQIEKDYEKTTTHAKAKHDGLVWLDERGVSLANVIYYDHTGKFSFGWRTPIDPDMLGELRGLLDGFPFPFEIVSDDCGGGVAILNADGDVVKRRERR